METILNIVIGAVVLYIAVRLTLGYFFPTETS
jgi:hypothetical protein